MSEHSKSSAVPSQQQTSQSSQAPQTTQPSQSGEPPKKRIRAVVACSHCRSKRSKCDGIPGQRACTQCQQRGIECEMSDGKRNRGHYKPQAEALAKRVRLLEEALAEARAANQELLRTHPHAQAQQAAAFSFPPWDHMEMDDGASVAPPSVFAMPNEIDVDAHSMILSAAGTTNNGGVGGGDAIPSTTAESLAPSSLQSMPPPSTTYHFYMPNTVYAPSVSVAPSHMMDHSASSVILGGGHEHAPSQHAPSHHAPSISHHSHHAPSHTHTQSIHGGHGHGHATGHSISMPRASMEPTAPAATTAALAATFAAAVAATPFPTLKPRAACCDDLDLSPPLVDYLLGLFFHRYQMMMKFVSQQDFMTLHQTGGTSERNQAQHEELYDSVYDSPIRGSAVLRKDCCHKHRSALFLAMLAAGLRYSTRPDVTNKFLKADGENRLATAARRAVETEVGRPTLATVQTVLILCEVETSLDNQMTGYMYSCLASKLIFEMGLDLGSASSSSALTAEETAIRHWLVWAASVHDQFWAVFLRRPLAIKNRTLQLSRLAWRFAGGGGSSSGTMPSGASSGHGHGHGGGEDDDLRPPPSFEDEVNDDLMDLMELAREITDELYGAGSPFQNRPTAAQAAAAAAAAVAAEAAEAAEKNAAAAASSSTAESPYDGGGLPHTYHQHAAQRHAHSQMPDVASLDARLNQWFNSLSERVRQGPVSGHDCYHFLFVLHLHFNATKIILHRTRAFPAPHNRNHKTTPSSYPLSSPNVPSPGSGQGNGHQGHSHNPSGVSDYAAAASMATLGRASICIAKLFETFRRREDIRTLQCTGVQWAAMASEALTWYIETLPIDGAIEAVAHLQSLSRTLKDMTRTFLPAVYPYDRTNHALRMFQRRIDGAESPPPIKGKAGVTQPQSASFETVMASQAYAQQGMHQHQRNHPSFHIDETASTVPSAPDLSTAATTVGTGANTNTSTNPHTAPAPPSIFEADAASVAAGGDGSVSVVSMSAVKELEQQHQKARQQQQQNQNQNQHQQPQHPNIGGIPAAGTWSEQDPWDWDDLLDR